MRPTAIFITLFTLFSMSPLSGEQIPAATPGNPLEACPDSPNCERSSQQFTTTTDITLEAALEVLEEMGAESVEKTSDLEVHAVFRIRLFGWRDDVHLALEPHGENGTMLHIRSASRVGYSDLGVNGRRINRFYRQLADTLR